MALDTAIQNLRLTYNYTLLETDVEKRTARMKLGSHFAGVLETMRDRIIDEAVERWLAHKRTQD
jgi:hypothetical protein